MENAPTHERSLNQAKRRIGFGEVTLQMTFHPFKDIPQADCPLCKERVALNEVAICGPLPDCPMIKEGKVLPPKVEKVVDAAIEQMKKDGEA